MAATPAWLAAIEALLNRGIGGSAQAGALASRLESKSLRVDLSGLPSVRVGVAHGILGLVVSEEPADATISGSPGALLNLARGVPSRGRETAAAQVRGDAEVANHYRQLFALARPDVEEEMSRIIGDLPARRLSQLAQQTFDWLRRAQRTAGENVAEYLQEESRDLVNRSELEEFLQGVDGAREIADRIEARLARLERQVKGAV